MPDPLLDHLRSAAQTTPAELLARLGVDPEGLAWREADAKLATTGPNEIASQRPPAWPLMLWHAVRDPFNGVLFLLCVVSGLTHD